jgi:dTDP-glucose 4,6-dehydratase
VRPDAFIQTNIVGTFNLLQAARARQGSLRLFHHVSTDEVFGSLGEKGAFSEKTAYSPNSPYSASKAASDHLVRAYHRTYGLPVTISNCTNNYGPYQFPEKFIPLMIVNAMRDMPLPVYGDGLNVREWIHTHDHNEAIIAILRHGKPGEIYNIGSGEERRNIDIVRIILGALGKPETLIRFVEDRLAHDRRYAIDCTKLRTELGWTPRTAFEHGIGETIRWYTENPAWWGRVMSGEYRSYYDTQYSQRFVQHP